MKAVKVFVTGALMAVLCVALCSCNWLDEKKAQRAVYDGNSIEYNGHTYANVGVHLPYELFDSYWSRVIVVEDDLPVLLTGMFGMDVSTTWDGKVLRFRGQLFASDEMSEAEVAALSNVKLDRYRLPNWDGREPSFVSDEFTQALRATLEGDVKEADEIFEADTSALAGSGWVYESDALGYFTGRMIDIEWYESGKVYACCDYELYYEVPEKYRALMLESLMKADGKWAHTVDGNGVMSTEEVSVAVVDVGVAAPADEAEVAAEPLVPASAA